MRETAMLGQFLGAARVSYAGVRNDHDIRRPWIAAVRRQSGCIEELRQRSSPENLADARDIVRSRRLCLEQIHRLCGCAVAVQPEERDIVLGWSDAVGVEGRFRVGKTTGVGQNGGW